MTHGRFVGIDLNRCRSVIVRMTETGERPVARIDNHPVALGCRASRLVSRRSWCWRRPMAVLGRGRAGRCGRPGESGASAGAEGVGAVARDGEERRP
jgi:hypothetical protein